MSVLFFWVHGEWIVVQNKQNAREPLRGSRDLFVPRYNSFPMNPEKKTHSLNIFEKRVNEKPQESVSGLLIFKNRIPDKFKAVWM